MAHQAHMTIRHESDLGRWEMTVAAPPPFLQPYVREYVGYAEQLTQPTCRRELPTDEVPLIINFGAPVRIFEAPDQSRWTDFGSFTTGAYDTYVLVGTQGPSGGLQVNFTLLGARLFVGRPLADMANRAVALEDVFGPAARTLISELHDAPSWDARFAILDRELAARFLAAKPVAAEILCVWTRLVETGGRAGIGSIVAEAGWSQKHLISRFRDEIGLAPKAFARVLRFGCAVRRMKSGRAVRLVDLADACGYYDQAHFARDCRAFSGLSPGDLAASLLPDRGGFAVDA